MAEISVTDFKGMNLKEGLWNQGFSYFCSGMDFYGLGDDPTNLSYAGVLQSGLGIVAMAQAASTNNITAVINDFAWNAPTSQVFGIDISANARIYKWVPGTPNWILDHTATGVGRNICGYNNNIFYTAGTQLGQLAAGVYNDSFQTGLTASSPMPMKVFQGYLFVANGRYIDRYDGTTYQSQKLQIPLDYNIRSMEVFRDGLYVSADNGQFARIFIWDGSSPTFNDSIPLPNEKFAPTLQSSQGFLWVIGNRGGGSTSPSTSLTPIYIIEPGAQPDLLFELPLRRDTSFSPHTGVASYQNGVLIGSCEVATGSFSSYAEDVGGLWFVGKDISTGLFHASLLFDEGIDVIIGGIFSSGVTQVGTTCPAVYIANDKFLGSHSYGVDQIIPFSDATATTVTLPHWTSLPIDAGSTKRKSWTDIRLNFDALPLHAMLRVDYDVDESGTFTVLKTFRQTDPTTDRFQLIPINRSGRTINIRVVVGSSGGTFIPFRIHGFTLYYEPWDN